MTLAHTCAHVLQCMLLCRLYSSELFISLAVVRHDVHIQQGGRGGIISLLQQSPLRNPLCLTLASQVVHCARLRLLQLLFQD